MKYILLSTLFFFSVAAQAQQACYETEKNVTTKKMFTEDEYTAALADWDAQEPEDPGLIALYAGYSTSKSAQAEIKGNKLFKGDKRKHCYIGCRIAQDVDYATALYAAWYKEKKDLTDCVESSYFEHRDHEATLQGASLGQANSDPKHCLSECAKIKRY